MLKNVQERLNRKAQPYDHIGWYGVCGRCGSNRYVFIGELRKLGRGNYVDIRGVEYECSGLRCKGKARIKGRVPPFRATHLNDIKRRETLKS